MQSKKVTIKNKKIKLGSSVFAANPITDSYKNKPIYVNKMLCDYYAPNKKTIVKIKNGTTVIASSIFANSKVKKVIVPKSVKSIGDTLFFGCPYINTIIVHKDNDVFDSRKKCNAIIKTGTNQLIVGCNKTKIPNTVTSIGDGAFASCANLTNITIPGSVKTIGDVAFMDCYKLKTIKFSKGLIRIKDDAFSSCNKLNTVILPDGLEIIGNSAFHACTNLTNVIIPESTKSIGREAFYSCKKMRSITIPVNVSYIGNKAIGYTQENRYSIKIEGFIIYGVPGSAAEKYAEKNEITFISVA